VGGLICVAGQLLMDLTKANIQPAHVLVAFVTGGVILGGLACTSRWSGSAGRGLPFLCPASAIH
jgi:stage V sporulation protein AE